MTRPSIIGSPDFPGNGTTANSGTLTSTLTVPSGTQLCVFSYQGNKTTPGHFSGGTVTMTKGGSQVAMTLVPNSSGADASSADYQGAIWSIVNPDVGTNKTITWDWAGTGTLDDAARLASIAFFQDVDTASPVRDGGGHNAGGLPQNTATMTATSDDLIYVVAHGASTGGEGTVSTWTNCTGIFDFTGGDGNLDFACATAAPTGNQSVGYSAVTNWFGTGIVAIVIKGVAAGSPYTLTAETGTLTAAGQAATLKVGPWEIVGVGTSVEVTGTAHTLTVPAGVQQNDLLVAVISSRIASTTSITLPTGGEWTRSAEQKTNNVLTTGSAVASGMMAYCIRGASNPNLTFTHPTAPSVALGRIVAYRGGFAGGYMDQSNSATTAVSTTAVSVAGVTTTFANDLIVVGLCGGQEAAWSAVDATNPSVASGATNTTTRPTANTWIERAEQVTTTGADTSLAIADGVRATAGATGNITATASVAASHVVLINAFRPVVTSLAPYTLVAGLGTATLSGQTAVLKTALPAGLGTLTAAGQTVTLRIARKVVAGLGTLTLSGRTATLRYTRAPMVAGLGTLTLAGQAVTLRAVRKLVAGLGTLTLSGQPAALKRSYVMPAGTGTLTLAGQTVILTKSAAVTHYSMPADAGTLTLSGQTVSLRTTRKLVAGLGTLTLAGQTMVPRVTLPAGTGTLTASGQAVALRTARKLVAGQGTLTLSGQTAVLRTARKLTAGTGTLTLSGQTVVPKVTLPAGLGTLTLSGQPVTLTPTFTGQTLAAGTGTVTLAGQAADLFATVFADYVMSAGAGTLLLTGQPANLVKTGAYLLAAGTGTLTLTGQAAVLRTPRRMAAGSGTIILSGQPVSLNRTGAFTLPVGTGAIVLSGQPVDLAVEISGYTMPAAHGTFVLTGQEAALTRTLTTVTAQPGRLTFGRKVVLRRW